MRAWALGIGLWALTAPLAAHHSFEVEYDARKPIEGTGVISKVEWTNPHMRVYIDVTDEKGVVTSWNLELGSPNSVLRRGWTRADLKVGDNVSFKGYGGRKILTRAVADSITLSDGRAFTGASGAPDAPRAQ
ncbi:MAG: hypothetical protein HYU37_01800 [Acidobacteria bacterium]|nr:hypothetical protein [Acidobacteriota bacterium]